MITDDAEVVDVEGVSFDPSDLLALTTEAEVMRLAASVFSRILDRPHVTFSDAASRKILGAWRNARRAVQ